MGGGARNLYEKLVQYCCMNEEFLNYFKMKEIFLFLKFDLALWLRVHVVRLAR